jgi:hypothetical protein
MTGQNWTFNGIANMSSATQTNARLVSAVRSVASGGNGADWSDPASWVILSRVQATSAIHSENVVGVMNIAFDTPYVISITRNSGASIGVINGVTRVTSSSSLAPLNTTSGLRIGRSINPGFEANEHWAGLGSEIILLQNLSTTDRQTIEINQMQYYGIGSCRADYDFTLYSSRGMPGFQGNCFLVTNEQIRWLQLNNYIPDISTAPDNKTCPTKSQFEGYIGGFNNVFLYGSAEYIALANNNCVPIGYWYPIPK